MEKKNGSAVQAEMESKELNQLRATKKQLALKLKTFVVIGEEDITGVRGWLVQMNSPLFLVALRASVPNQAKIVAVVWKTKCHCSFFKYIKTL